jgi:hypothetical protein
MVRTRPLQGTGRSSILRLGIIKFIMDVNKLIDDLIQAVLSAEHCCSRAEQNHANEEVYQAENRLRNYIERLQTDKKVIIKDGKVVEGTLFRNKIKMKAHDLANKLLAGPNVEVITDSGNNKVEYGNSIHGDKLVPVVFVESAEDHEEDEDCDDD